METASRGMARKQQKEATRLRLLSVSLRLFIRRGYGETSIRDIATAAEVSTGLFFHYFASKETVLTEHAKTAQGGVTSVIAKLQENRPPRDLFSDISQMILGAMKQDYFRYLYLLVNQIHSLDSIPPGIKQILDPSQPIKASIPVIATGQKTGQFREGDPLTLATVYWAAIQGIAESITWNETLPVPDPEILMGILEATTRA